ncbi:nuclear transport factor 2 family protein [Aquirufa sp. ROCK-SH2]
MKTIYNFGLLVILLFGPFYVQATNHSGNDEKENIKAVILKTFSAMKSVDSVALKSCFTPNAVLHVSQIRPEGNIIREVPIAKFVQNVMTRKSGDLDERVISWGEILVDHEIASAWVPYEFYLNGKFTHKGVDVFLFIKVGDEWRIQTLMYNMQKE